MRDRRGLYQIVVAMAAAFLLMCVPLPAIAAQADGLTQESTPAEEAQKTDGKVDAKDDDGSDDTSGARKTAGQGAAQQSAKQPEPGAAEQLMQKPRLNSPRHAPAQTSTTQTPATQTPAQTPKPTVPERTVDDGTYVIETGAADNHVADVNGNRTANGTNVQTYTYNGSSAQRWDIAHDQATGYYSVAKAGTHGSMVLDVSGGRAARGANVQLYRRNGTAAQRWLLRELGGGAIQFVSALPSSRGTALVLDVSGGSRSNGANL